MTAQPTNEMVIIIRPSFKKVCGPDACRAALYNHILYRLARKAKDEPEAKTKAGDIFWYASAEDICQDIDEAWCVNKVRKEIKQLVTAGLIGQRHNPAKGWDRKYQYFIGPDQGQKLLEKTQKEEVCLLHIGLNTEVTHLLHMVNAFNKNGACICHKDEMDLPNTGDASTINGGAIPEGSTQGSSEESTEGAEGTSNIASSLPTPAPSQKFMYSLDQGLKQPWEQEEPYHPDFSASQEKQGDVNGRDEHSNNVSGSHSGSNHHGGMGSLEPAVGNPQRIAPAQQQAGRLQVSDEHSQLTAHGITRQEAQAVASQSLPAQASGYEKPAELSTLLGSSPQVSAKVEPKQNNTSSKVVASGKRGIPATAQLKPQLTLLGGQVREWYDVIRATRTRLTAKNVDAFNVLSELDGMSFESLKEVMDSIEDDPWVKARPTFTFDVQDLASEDGKWRFDRWYQVVQRNRQKQASQSAQPKPTSSSLPSFSAMSDAEYRAYLRGGTTNARFTHAR